ncbi:hypothetical protein ABIE66_001760 [Peribacillus sp. B2I2]
MGGRTGRRKLSSVMKGFLSVYRLEVVVLLAGQFLSDVECVYLTKGEGFYE